MEALTAQLQKVNTEIDALNSKAEKAAEGYKSAAGTSQEAATKDVWLQLVQEKAVLLPLLLQERQALGVPTFSELLQGSP